MQANETYQRDGGVLLKELLSPELAQVLLAGVHTVVARSGGKLLSRTRVSNRPAYELYGYHFPPLAAMHWGLTAHMEALSGVKLFPTYAFFRTYQQGDICTVHSDRHACEHSLSLTLGYSDGRPWALSVGRHELSGDEQFQPKFEQDFGGEPYTDYPMEPGDAVMYKGVQYRHGRLQPNPNRWSAHLFLHWVDRNGPFRDFAFDKRSIEPREPIDFRFPQAPAAP